MTYLAVGETPTHLNLMSTDSYLWMSHGDPFCNVVWEGWANTDFMGYPGFLKLSCTLFFFFFYLAFLTVQHFILGGWLALCILEQVSSVCLVFLKSHPCRLGHTGFVHRSTRCDASCPGITQNVWSHPLLKFYYSRIEWPEVTVKTMSSFWKEIPQPLLVWFPLLKWGW